MFRIACLVRDKQLAEVLYAVDGKVFDLEVIPVKVPVIAKEEKPELIGKEDANLDKFKAWPIIRDLPSNSFTLEQAFAAAPGLSRSAFYNALRAATKAGAITRLGHGIYHKEPA
jgi:hypothetical protein